MEQKIEQLLLKGISTIIEYKDLFLKEWKELLPALKYQNNNLIEAMEEIFDFAIHKVTDPFTSVDSLIHTLLRGWQKHIYSQYNEHESIFFVTIIENLFHKLIADNPNAAFIDHQSVQAFFLRILDQGLLMQDFDRRTEKWANIILATNVVPMKWLAVLKKDDLDFQIEDVVCADEDEVDSHLLKMCTSLRAHQIDHLSQAIERLLGTGKGDNPILKIQCLSDILLVCLEDGDSKVYDHQIDFIREIYLRQVKLHHLESKIGWKNTSLLFLQHLLRSRNAEDAMKAITKGLVDYMPFERCALFLYNHLENKGIGVCGYNVNHSSILQIKENIFNMPLFKKYLHSLFHSQPLFLPNASEVLPDKYVRDFKLKSVVILPIFVPTHNKRLGIAVLDQGDHSDFAVSPQTLTALIKFGHYAGELLFSFWDEAMEKFSSQDGVLTQREKEVLKLIAEGASIHEAARELHLSSYTVRDYVSVIIQKLEAKNRTDAAVKAIKMKLIS